MLTGLSQLSASSAATRSALRPAYADPYQPEDEDPDRWAGTRMQRISSFRYSVADIQQEMHAQMGALGQHGFKVAACLGLYVGMRVAYGTAREQGLEQAALWGLSVFALGCAAGWLAQTSRRRFVLSKGGQALRRMERFRGEIMAADELAPSEAKFLAELDHRMAELRPLVRAQLVRRGA